MAKYEKWDGAIQYVPGDEVLHHGVLYRAKMPIMNPLIEPHAGEHNLHWERVGRPDHEQAPARKDEPVVEKPKS